jgi:hypothetical protein
MSNTLKPAKNMYKIAVVKKSKILIGSVNEYVEPRI